MKKAVIVILAILVLAAGAGGFMVFGKGSEGAAVKVFDSKRESITSTVTATGVVEEGESYNIYLDSSARVKNVYVKEGSVVKKGEVLAELNVTNLKIKLEEAKLNYNIDKINVRNLMQNQEGKDTLQAETMVDTAKMEVKQSSMNLEEAKREIDESTQLYNMGALSKSELDTAEQAFKAAKINLEGAQLKLDNALKQLESARKSSSKSDGSINAQVEMQQNKMALSELKIKELMESCKDVNLETGKVLSPIDGTVAIASLSEGDFVKAGEASIKIVKLDELTIKAKINENDIKDVRVGNKVTISGDSVYPNEYRGEVVSISPVARKEVVDRTEQTVLDVQIKVVDGQTLLKPGFNIDARIETKSMDGVLAVMKDAVKEDKDGKRYLYIVDGGKVKKVYVDIVIQSDTFAGIKAVDGGGGITENSPVIYFSSTSLQEGMAVTVTKQK